jgi:hypothetical protein
MVIEEKSYTPLGKKHNWVERGNSGYNIEIIIKDEHSRRIDGFKVNSKKSWKEILDLINIKYGW